MLQWGNWAHNTQDLEQSETNVSEALDMPQLCKGEEAALEHPLLIAIKEGS